MISLKPRISKKATALSEKGARIAGAFAIGVVCVLDISKPLNELILTVDGGRSLPLGHLYDIVPSKET
jgi:hypothetical protein